MRVFRLLAVLLGLLLLPGVLAGQDDRQLLQMVEQNLLKALTLRDSLQTNLDRASVAIEKIHMDAVAVAEVLESVEAVHAEAIYAQEIVDSLRAGFAPLQEQIAYLRTLRNALRRRVDAEAANPTAFRITMPDSGWAYVERRNPRNGQVVGIDSLFVR